MTAKRGGRRVTKVEVDAMMRRLFPAKPWRGRVERLEHLGPERREALGIPTVETRRSEVAIRLCSNPYCRHWTPTRFRRCVVCHMTGQ